MVSVPGGMSFADPAIMRHAAVGADEPGAPEEVLALVSPQEINTLFIRTDQLDSDAIVDFVKALCEVSREELANTTAPRVFSLTKIVEIAHFNMQRIRIVWTRIWGVLSEYFIAVGCHTNLNVAMYAVDQLRQLAMKFLERDELVNYHFQNDFLKPFVVVMRNAKALEVREWILRCVSQMVQARVRSIKSGWKSMFMVFTTAASDSKETIVQLAFETVEKIVRHNFTFITETESTTFTDCCNCLIAFTNNSHSLDVALNSIAFLRFCAIRLAEGSIGELEGTLPEGTELTAPTTTRIVATDQDPAERLSPRPAKLDQSKDNDNANLAPQKSNGSVGLRFTDKDEHVYFWFPLLAGLSELTFDPRPDIRYGALEVLFDTLKDHGHSFSSSFWERILDSVLLPIFDHVRAEVTENTTFVDEKNREQVDAWLYETCTHCLEHLVDLFVAFQAVMGVFVGKLMELVSNFMGRSHQSLAAIGVAALVRYMTSSGSQMNHEQWDTCITCIANTLRDTSPDIHDLLAPLANNTMNNTAATTPREGDVPKAEGGGGDERVSGSGPAQKRGYSLREGGGARRLADVKVKISVQILLIQACGEIYRDYHPYLGPKHINTLLTTLQTVIIHARDINTNIPLRTQLAASQTAFEIVDDKRISDPPLLRLESEAVCTQLSVLLHQYVVAQEQGGEGVDGDVSGLLTRVCEDNLKSVVGLLAREEGGGGGVDQCGG